MLACLYVQWVCSTRGGQKKASELFQLEFQTVPNHQVSARNWPECWEMTWGPLQKSALSVLSCCVFLQPHYFWDTASPWIWGLWLSGPQWAFCFHTPSPGIIGAHHHTQLLLRNWWLNSNLHASVVGTMPAALSPSTWQTFSYQVLLNLAGL